MALTVRPARNPAAFATRPAVSRLGLALAIVVGVVLMAAAGCAARTPHIADVQHNPGRYNDRSVTVEGTVTSSWGVPLVPFKLYKVDDGTGEITVVSQGNRTPSRGAQGSRARPGGRGGRLWRPVDRASPPRTEPVVQGLPGSGDASSPSLKSPAPSSTVDPTDRKARRPSISSPYVTGRGDASRSDRRRRSNAGGVAPRAARSRLNPASRRNLAAPRRSCRRWEACHRGTRPTASNMASTISLACRCAGPLDDRKQTRCGELHALRVHRLEDAVRAEHPHSSTASGNVSSS